MGEIGIGNKIRALRIRKNLRLKELAKRSGFTESFISKVEREGCAPSLASLKKILAVLGTDLGHFFDDRETKFIPDIVVRKGERKEFLAEKSGIKLELLVSDVRDKKMEPLLVDTKVGGHSGSGEYSHAGEEFDFVLKGKVELLLGENKYILTKGDSVYFDASISHHWRNTGDIESTILRVVSPPTF